MIIFIQTNDEYIIQGWSSTRCMDEEVEVEIENDHPFLSSRPKDFQYLDGTIVKNETLILKEAKQRKFDELDAKCEEEILGYFKASVNDEEYLFSFDEKAQSNFIGVFSLFTQGLITEIEWTAWQDEEAKRVTLDKDQFTSVVLLAFAHRDGKVKRLRNELQPILEACETLEEINEVTW
jgi:hypothetical protein